MPVNSEVLGLAFEPEQRFENPDGSSISFDRDYFGRKRGRFPVSGPFEECGTDRFTVQTPDDASSKIGHEEKIRIEDKWKADLNPKESDVDEINANIVLTGGMNAVISFPFDGELFKVSDMFVKGNEIWLYDSLAEKLVELDCEYGIYHNIKKWSIGALQSLDMSEDANAEGLARTAGTLLCILNKSLAHDAADTCETIQNKVNAGLGDKGISMRFTPKNLKFIRGKKFISLEDVLYRISKGTKEVVTERIEHLN